MAWPLRLSRFQISFIHAWFLGMYETMSRSLSLPRLEHDILRLTARLARLEGLLDDAR